MVDFTEDEHTRLRAIKDGDRVQGKNERDVLIGARVPVWLRDKAKRYVKSRGITMNVLMSNVLEVLTCDEVRVDKI